MHMVAKDDDDNSPEFFVGVLSLQHNMRHGWWKNILINGESLRCKIDTGAEANVMSKETYECFGDIRKLSNTNVVLTAYGNKQIRPMGVVNVWAETNHSFADIEFFLFLNLLRHCSVYLHVRN